MNNENQLKKDLKLIDNYIANVLSTWDNSTDNQRVLFGVYEESGELIGKEKKRLRGDIFESFENDVKKEVGDILYYLRLYGHLNNFKIENIEQVFTDFDFFQFNVWFAKDYISLIEFNKQENYIDLFNDIYSFIQTQNFDFSEIIKMNIDKLRDRHKRGKIKGSGDNR